MTFAHLHNVTGKICPKRPLTYSYLSCILKNFQKSSVLAYSKFSSKDNAGNCCYPPIDTSNLKRCVFKRQYSKKVKLTPEQKQVYRNPKLGYTWTPELATLIREKIWPGDSLKHEEAVVLDCNAGPGLISKELLDAGVRRLISIDRNRDFIPSLKELQGESDGRLLQVLHADFYKMQYHGNIPYAPPVIRINELFQNVSPVRWDADVPIKVLGCFPHRKEKTQAYLFASLMLERLSIYAFGRAQFNFLLSQSCYETITQPPGSYFKYRALSALYQLGFDIKLLHKEPLSSFASPSAVFNASNPKNSPFLYLTQLTPKQDLFNRHKLSQQQAFIFIYFMRQSLSRRSLKLTEIIEKWAPGYGHVVSELGLPQNIRSGDVYGETLLQIFLLICEQDTFNGSWMGEDAMAYARKALPSVL